MHKKNTGEKEGSTLKKEDFFFKKKKKKKKEWEQWHGWLSLRTFHVHKNRKISKRFGSYLLHNRQRGAGKKEKQRQRQRDSETTTATSSVTVTTRHTHSLSETHSLSATWRLNAHTGNELGEFRERLRTEKFPCGEFDDACLIIPDSSSSTSVWLSRLQRNDERNRLRSCIHFLGFSI